MIPNIVFGRRPTWARISGASFEEHDMAAYVILSKLSADAMKDPGEFRQLGETVAKKIKAQCPGVRWKDSYALMGRYDVVDIVEANSPAEVEKAAMIIRCYGHARTETMPATPWKEFLGSM
jgi:uncharacterized protein with GYD domain